VNFCYVNHGHDMVECCALETPCPFHAQFAGAVRSPHITREMAALDFCATCRPPSGTIVTE